MALQRSGVRSPSAPPFSFSSIIYVAEAEPGGHQLQLRVQALARVGRGAGLEVDDAREQPSRLAVGLEIDTGDEGVVRQEGQHVIAMPALRRGRVDLDPVVESKQAF